MFEKEKEYFEAALELFHENQWLFKHPVTEILMRNCLKSFPNGWLEHLKDLSCQELNDFVTGRLIKDNWPKTLILFAERCKELDRLPGALELSAFHLPKRFSQGLSVKKQREIFYFTQLIHQKCSEHEIHTIIDLGAGLGYICQMLHYQHGYRVLGLESSSSNVKTAKERQNSLYPDSIRDIEYICCNITDDSVDLIERNLKGALSIDKNEKICLIGLHSCADLSVNACRLFSRMKSASLLIMLSCCYHKLSADENNHFNNFPVSKTLRDIIKDNNDTQEALNRPFLRLACQEPASRWEEMSEEAHQQHAFCVLARAVLESFAHQHGFSMKKCVRKGTRMSQCTNFETYLVDSLRRYTFNDKKYSGDVEFVEEIRQVWEEHREKLDATEIYSGLQLLLQSPAESLILHDRRCWLLEQGFRAEIIPVLSNKISPRCHAIVANK